MAQPRPAETDRARMQRAPVLVADHRNAFVLDPAGSARRLTHRQALEALTGATPIVCHARALGRRVGAGPVRALDLLELFAFVHPARFCLPTAGGLAAAVGLAPPSGLEAEARALAVVGDALLAELAALEADARRDAIAAAETMAAGGWPWGPAVLDALGVRPEIAPEPAGGLDVWRRLPEWAEQAPEPPPGNVPVETTAARARLAALVGEAAEPRPQQVDYAGAVTAAFLPRDEAGRPHVVLAEAGTGVGKTLGYIAPASLWAELNEGAVWLSTFTRNLQRQIDTELDRLHPDPEVKARRVVVRKGRENYLCLLNLEEAVAGLRTRPGDATALGLVARWAAATRDGDMQGGDFPAWLADLLGPRNTIALADRRGECIYSACAHYHKCFVERAVRRARRADVVVANHALVMTQAALGGLDDASVPTRLVFDEGHHVFDAADNAFSAHLGGQEAADLRRWLLGNEEGRSSRARGLKARIEDIAGLDGGAAEALEAVLAAARALPGPGWLQRVAGGAPRGPAEAFLARVRQQVYARAADAASPYDLEADTAPPVPGLVDEAERLGADLARLSGQMTVLCERLGALADEHVGDFDTPTRNRIEAVRRGLRRRSDGLVEAWRAMLAGLEDGAPESFVDWFAVSRVGGRDVDVGMHRHWLDPTVPLAQLVIAPAHGVVLTSATLRDGTGEEEADWAAAEARTGAAHIETAPQRALAASPFDYPARTRVLVVTDVRKDALDQVAAAYRELFLAAGGGALGLFTAISRLRQVHERIAPALEDAGIPLHAQHVDHLDNTSLVEIFRAVEDSCLLGTDAMRDGVDVPGRSLRMIVFDRVPWHRRSILHRARRHAFGGGRYDDMLARLRLKQAYGRLIRRAGDKGVFVVLDPMMPSRLAGAFPEGVPIHRLGLKDALALTRAFLAEA